MSRCSDALEEEGWSSLLRCGTMIVWTKSRPRSNGDNMRIHSFALAGLAFLAMAADTQKTTAPATAKVSPDTKQNDIVRFLAALGMPKANSEAARKQITTASKDPKLSSYPAAYWQDYLESAAPATFEKILVPIFDKAYTHEEIKACLKMYGSAEFKQVMEKHPEGMLLLFEKNPAMLRGQAFEAFSTHMTEVGRKLQQKHGIKAPESKK
jgi:hypothetical protein